MAHNHQNTSVAGSLATPEDQNQRQAAIDPRGSFIVQAPAGSGKTTLLVERYLSLLGIVSEPEEILAITFTRKAAKEMRARVLRELKNEKSHRAQIALKRSEDRNWNLIENPQRMRIQTIDSFVHGLVHQLPYQSQLSLDFGSIESTDFMFQEAVSNTLNRIARSTSEFADQIADTLGLLDNDYRRGTEQLVEMLRSREHWLEAITLVAAGTANLDNPSDLIKALEKSRNSYIQHLIDDATTTLGQSAFDQFRELVPPSLAFLDSSIVSDGSMDHPEEWAQFVNLIITQKPSLRKGITKREGIPADEKELKEKWFEAIDLIEEDFDCKKLERVKKLPERKLSKEHQQALHSIAITLIACAQELKSVFENKMVVDFTETAIAARRALQVEDAPTQLALALDYRIRHILVDEFQDTSVSQNQLLNQLIEGWEVDDGNTMFVVGDPMQSIYGFRNADLSNFIKADKGGIRNRVLEKLTLVSNFRSSNHLVEFCNKTFEKILGSVDELESGRVAFSSSKASDRIEDESSHGLTLCHSESQHLEAQLVAKKITELKNKYKGETIAVLFRARTKLDPYFSEFRREGLRWKAVQMESLSDVPVVRDLYALTCVLYDVEDYQQWLAVLMSPLAGLDFDDIERLSKIGQEGRPLDMLLKSSELQLTEQTRKTLNRIQAPILEALRSQHRSLRSRVERLFYQLGGANAYYRVDQPASDATTKSNAEHYLDLVEQFDSEVIDMSELFSRVSAAYATALDEEADVEVMSIHKAKGLEFDHVILPFLNQRSRAESTPLIFAQPHEDGLVISHHSTVSPDPLHACLFSNVKEMQTNEEMRLLYVAATRAKRTLWMYGTQEADKNPKKGTNLPTMLDATDKDDWTIVEDESIDSNDTESVPVEESNGTKIRTRFRLDPSFRFVAPDTLPIIPPNAFVEGSLTKRYSNGLDLGLSDARAIGDIVHAELQRRVEERDFETTDEDRVTLWRNELRSNGFDTQTTNRMIETIQQQITQTLDSKEGRWVLDPTHQDSATEVSQAINFGANHRTFIVDRTFISDGVRWIVDYKTSRFPDDRDLPITEKALEHQLQLIRYAYIYERLGSEPVKAAIYFTDVPELVEVDISEDARLAQIRDLHDDQEIDKINEDLLFSRVEDDE